MVASEKRIPIAAPDNLDYVPASSTESAFEFVNDLSVPAHRTIETLQIAVNDEDEIVELLTCSHCECAKRFRFVGLTVAQKSPDFSRRLLDQLTVFEIAHQSRLVYGVDRPDPHRDRRKTPKIRHEPRMRV